MVGILVAFWEGPFSGAMLVLGRVNFVGIEIEEYADWEFPLAAWTSSLMITSTTWMSRWKWMSKVRISGL